MECSGYYGEDGDAELLSSKVGVSVQTWCAPALNNKGKPYKLSWLKDTALPPALVLDLPFYDVEKPEANAAFGSSNRLVAVFCVVCWEGRSEPP